MNPIYATEFGKISIDFSEVVQALRSAVSIGEPEELEQILADFSASIEKVKKDARMTVICAMGE